MSSHDLTMNLIQFLPTTVL